MRIQHLDKDTKKSLLEDLLRRSPSQYEEYEKGVNEILLQVKSRGDESLCA